MTLHEDFRTFFMSKDVDFEQAVQGPVHHTGNRPDSFTAAEEIETAQIKMCLSPGLCFTV